MRKNYTIPNMHCPACNMHLEGIEDELPGILFVKANYKKQSMDIEFDEQQVSEEQIREAIEEMGYDIA